MKPIVKTIEDDSDACFVLNDATTAYLKRESVHRFPNNQTHDWF